MLNSYKTNTLKYNSKTCTHCGMCATVCPHAVFARNDNKKIYPAQAEACMECGACQLNCPSGAIFVDSGTGCATAMILAALTGKKESRIGTESDPAVLSSGN